MNNESSKSGRDERFIYLMLNYAIDNQKSMQEVDSCLNKVEKAFILIA